MTELDDDFDAQDEINPFETNNNNHTYTSPPNTNLSAPTYNDEAEEYDEDYDLNPKQKPPTRIKELDDSGDELEENEKHLQQQFKQNFNNLFANNNNIDNSGCVVQEEIESKEYNQEHGEEKMEPFNLREERGEGYFDQFLNYHKTNKQNDDEFYVLMDEEKEKNKTLYQKKYQLSTEIIEKHKQDYEKFETANTDIDLLHEWKSLLPLFSNNTQSIKQVMQILSKSIKNHENIQNNHSAIKKRKLNANQFKNIYDNESIKKKKKKKKKRMRAWEITSDEDNEESINKNNILSEHELLGCKRKFEIFSEKATMLFANGDHNIYEQTRDLLIERIKVVENEELFHRKKQQAIERKKHVHIGMQRGKEKFDMDVMLDDFSDDDVDGVDVGKDGGDVLWEYYWQNDGSKQKHGPFSGKQMFEWSQHFKTQAIMFKRVNEMQWLDSNEVDLIGKLYKTE